MLFRSLFPLVKLTEEEIVITSIEGETQGVQRDNTAGGLLLHVLPENTSLGYIIYENQDINSQQLYIAKDGEEFKVIDETDKWFKVEVNTEITGWLHKTSVKSVTEEER